MNARTSLRICNALTVDVEDYFQVSAFETHIDRAEWDVRPCRVESNVERILALCEEQDVHATFFTLGWIAERYPAMVRRIAHAGHEVASHGYGHARVTALTPEAFTRDLQRTKSILEDITGEAVQGFRAPSFSIGPANAWAFECIRNAGYRYSSSVYPIRHDHYGAPDSERFAHEVVPGLLELPIATIRLFNANWPAGGGGYFRLLPYAISRWSLARLNRVDGCPAMFYLHPWELDPGQPVVEGIPLRTRFRHYVNLDATESRLRRLLADFSWDRADRIFLERGRR